MENFESRIVKKRPSLEKEKTIQEFIDSRIEELLSRETPLNAGNNGIIYKIDLEDMGPDAESFFRERGISPETDAVAKLLKIYMPGTGEKEFGMQKKAYEVLENQGDESVPLAQIPKPFEDREVLISDDTRQKLNKDGALLGGNTAEVVLMDLVPGKDLATILFEAILAYKGEEAYMGGFDGLHRRVVELLDLKVPGGKAVRSADRELEARKLLIEQSKTIYDFLHENGFAMHPNLVQKLENTLNLLHANGIRHNDMHERNIMINGEVGNPDAEVYIIDFGSADAAKVEGRTDDFDVIRRLRQDLIEGKGSREAELEEERAEMARFFESYMSTAAGYREYETLKDKDLAYIQSRARSISRELEFKKFLAVLYGLQAEGRISREEVLGIFDEVFNYRTKKTRAWKTGRPHTNLAHHVKIARPLFEEDRT